MYCELVDFAHIRILEYLVGTCAPPRPSDHSYGDLIGIIANISVHLVKPGLNAPRNHCTNTWH